MLRSCAIDSEALAAELAILMPTRPSPLFRASSSHLEAQSARSSWLPS